jgi:hypothetical protein
VPGKHKLLRYESRGPIETKKQINNNNNNSVALVRERAIPTELPPLVGEVSVNLCG